MSSIIDDAEDPFNFSVYMDKVRRELSPRDKSFFLIVRPSCRLR